jgi:hypothetical protein
MIGIEAKGSTEMTGGTAEDDQPYIADYGECMDMGGEVAPSLTIESIAGPTVDRNHCDSGQRTGLLHGPDYRKQR